MKGRRYLRPNWRPSQDATATTSTFNEGPEIPPAELDDHWVDGLQDIDLQ